jgi:hypothetical protein
MGIQNERIKLFAESRYGICWRNNLIALKGGGIMKKIISIFFVVVVCVFVGSTAWTLESIDDAGTHISRSSNTSPVILAYYDGSPAGAAIIGHAYSTTGNTIGVDGRTRSNSGMGVYGYASSATGTTFGVYGKTDSPDGYAGYFAGRLATTGGLINPNTFWGIDMPVSVNDSLYVSQSLYVSGAISSSATTNLALSANSAIASSEYSPGYAADRVKDTIYGRWDEGEWASNGQRAGAWVQLNWAAAINCNKIVIYPRVNRYDQIYDAWLQIRRHDATVTDIHLGQFSNGGAPREIHLTQPDGTNVVAVKVLITETSPDTQNIGLSEIEVYRDKNIW